MRHLTVVLSVLFLALGLGGGHVPTSPGLYCKHYTHHHAARICVSIPAQGGPREL